MEAANLGNHAVWILVSPKAMCGSVLATGAHACISGDRFCPVFNMPLRYRAERILEKQCDCHHKNQARPLTGGRE